MSDQSATRALQLIGAAANDALQGTPLYALDRLQLIKEYVRIAEERLGAITHRAKSPSPGTGD